VGDAGTHTCGVAQAENCCTSIEVPGGAFDRSYDDFSTGYFSTYYPATVSGYRLDRFEVSIGRFAGFLRALAGAGDAGMDSGATGWRPEPGSGKHAHVNSGRGLSAAGGGYESGWQASWNIHLGYSFVAHQLSSCVNPGLVSFDPTTMEPAPGFTWSSPINCVDWAQAYAFCIWDGGFLPSEAEWNYAASGGAEQRVYPWSVAVDAGPDGGISCNQAVYVSATTQCFVTVQPVGSKSGPGGGDGKWAHADLGGNVLEWTLDEYTSPYPTPCLDCASLPRDVSGDAGTILRVQRGGSFVSSSRDVTASFRGFSPEGLASYPGGFRCARTP
jgi:formylglycine-generating enzyme required for sulfatase activity